MRYTKEQLKSYEDSISKDNLTVLRWMLLATVGVLIVLLVLLSHAMRISPETVSQIAGSIPVLTVAFGAIVLLNIFVFLMKEREEKVLLSKIFTVSYLSVINLTAMTVEVIFYPEQYSTVICGMLLISQIAFISYPVDNLIYISIVAAVFAVLDVIMKEPEIYIYDLMDSIPFLVFGMVLSWKKSQLKWETLIRAEHEKRLELKNVENELRQSRIDAMLAQIQPHFIYNTLEGIGELCHSNPAYAEAAVTEFSSYLRGNLSVMDDQRIVPFEQELEHVKHYLYCEKMRFDERLHIEYKIAAIDFSVPTLSLQPIVENAVRYGVSKKEEGGTITIETRENENEWLMLVSDEGEGFSDSPEEGRERKHIGIENVRYRLQQQCQGTLEIESKPGDGTIVTIKIPKKG